MSFLKIYPDLLDKEFFAQEKLDGANIQFFIESENKIMIGSRNQWVGNITPDSVEVDKFYNLASVLEESGLTDKFRSIAKDNVGLRFFGELYGDGVQKRIDYGPQTIKFFDVMDENGLLSSEASVELLNRLQLTQSSIFRKATLKQFLEEDKREFQSLECNDMAEGFVAKPVDGPLFDNFGKVIIFKFKSDKFNEKMCVQKSAKSTESNTQVLLWNNRFKELVNENRVASVFSKHGPIESPTMMGQYIKLVLDDAKEEFMELYGPDFENDNLEGDQIKKVFNVGGIIANLLKEAL
jgi:hypothetical protein